MKWVISFIINQKLQQWSPVSWLWVWVNWCCYKQQTCYCYRKVFTIEASIEPYSLKVKLQYYIENNNNKFRCDMTALMITKWPYGSFIWETWRKNRKLFKRKTNTLLPTMSECFFFEDTGENVSCASILLSLFIY